MPEKMTPDTLLPGRMIEDVPYTGLIERLSRISVIARVTDETAIDLEKADLLNFIAQIGEIAIEAKAFAGATHAEAMASFNLVLSGASTGPSGGDA